jgi:hypothetical protein
MQGMPARRLNISRLKSEGLHAFGDQGVTDPIADGPLGKRMSRYGGAPMSSAIRPPVTLCFPHRQPACAGSTSLDLG